MENTEKQTVRNGLKRKSLVFGLIVLGLGVAWLMRNFGLIGETTWDVIFSWQMLLIAIGVINISNDSSRVFGWILISIGGFFLLSDIYDWPTSFRSVFWPALLILIGLVLIFGSSKIFRRRHFSFSQGEDFIEEVSIFSGRERFIDSQAFRGGKVVSIFGGSKLDLTRAQLAEGEIEIENVSIFGGSTLIVPSDWNVKIEVFNIFGGYSDKRIRGGKVDYNKVVTVKGVAIFGGGEIKSF
ncbi:MAG: cell wall-active antibiotics response protein [Bacteroidales bacterium]|nr:cell wall-active antibiotics response protein [Bacteroidales bacterium]